MSEEITPAAYLGEIGGRAGMPCWHVLMDRALSYTLHGHARDHAAAMVMQTIEASVQAGGPLPKSVLLVHVPRCSHEMPVGADCFSISNEKLGIGVLR